MIALVVLAAILTIGLTANAQWSSSNSSCYAYTDCYSVDGWGRPYVNGRIHCHVYSGSYASVPGYLNTSCNYAVIKGRTVQCRGFMQVTDSWGRTAWQWQNVSFKCPGTW